MKSESPTNKKASTTRNGSNSSSISGGTGGGSIVSGTGTGSSASTLGNSYGFSIGGDVSLRNVGCNKSYSGRAKPYGASPFFVEDEFFGKVPINPYTFFCVDYDPTNKKNLDTLEYWMIH